MLIAAQEPNGFLHKCTFLLFYTSTLESSLLLILFGTFLHWLPLALGSHYNLGCQYTSTNEIIPGSVGTNWKQMCRICMIYGRQTDRKHNKLQQFTDRSQVSLTYNIILRNILNEILLKFTATTVVVNEAVTKC